ncbi:MAG: type III secretion system chaperone [Planctomycetota bacterium]|nr:type III secretion system chaperone [Planctomycetota bacterium]
MAELAALLDELGTRTGLGNIAFDKDGLCLLRFDDSHDVALTYDREAEALYLSGPAGSLGPDVRAAALLRLLSYSCLGANTGGAALGLPEDGDILVLWKRHDAGAFVDYTAFEAAINGFLGHLADLEERLPELLRSAGGPSPRRPSGPSGGQAGFVGAGMRM